MIFQELFEKSEGTSVHSNIGTDDKMRVQEEDRGKGTALVQWEGR